MKLLLALCCVLFASITGAHNVSDADALFVTTIEGPAPLPFLYLGAKHMVTGYDHLFFLAGVIFFLYKLRDVALYVTLFTVGHSLTLVTGVVFDLGVNAYLVDAIIGLSIVYKAFENLDGFRTLFGVQPNAKIAVLAFGLFHGLGLATKLQELVISPDGLYFNLVAFNLGVELGQVLALSFLLLLFVVWRGYDSFRKQAVNINVLLMGAGWLLAAYQLFGYFQSTS